MPIQAEYALVDLSAFYGEAAIAAVYADEMHLVHDFLDGLWRYCLQQTGVGSNTYAEHWVLRGKVEGNILHDLGKDDQSTLQTVSIHAGMWLKAIRPTTSTQTPPQSQAWKGSYSLLPKSAGLSMSEPREIHGFVTLSDVGMKAEMWFVSERDDRRSVHLPLIHGYFAGGLCVQFSYYFEAKKDVMRFGNGIVEFNKDKSHFEGFFVTYDPAVDKENQQELIAAKISLTRVNDLKAGSRAKKLT